MARRGVADAVRVPVVSDAMDVAARIAALDPGYFVCMRRADGRFEVHHEACVPSYQLTLPFDRMDARAVEWVRRTAVARAGALMAEVDGHNAGLEA